MLANNNWKIDFLEYTTSYKVYSDHNDIQTHSLHLQVRAIQTGKKGIANTNIRKIKQQESERYQIKILNSNMII